MIPPPTDDRSRLKQALAPVQDIDDEPLERPQSGIGLCLSGGGYRAMVFHIGLLVAQRFLTPWQKTRTS